MSIQLWSPPEKETKPDAPPQVKMPQPVTWKSGPVISMTLGLMLLGLFCFSLGAGVGWMIRGSQYVNTLVALGSSSFLKKNNLSLEEIENILHNPCPSPKKAQAKCDQCQKEVQPTNVVQEKDVTPYIKPVEQPYTIQLGVFASESNAKDLFSSMTMEGIQCKILEISDNNQVLYAVRTGNYNSFNEAQAARKTLTSQHNSVSVVLIPLPKKSDNG